MKQKIIKMEIMKQKIIIYKIKKKLKKNLNLI